MDARGKTESIRGFGESDESTTAREEEVGEGGEEERGKGGRKEEIDRKERGIYHWVPWYHDTRYLVPGIPWYCIYLIHSLLLLLVYITRTYSVRMYLRVYLFHLHSYLSIYCYLSV